MGAITDSFADSFRDYVTAGLPASGAHEPVKAEIRATGAIVDVTISSVVNGTVIGAAVVYATRAALYADLAHLAGKLGVVYNDGTAAYNGIYVKSGGSGAGSWAITGLALPSTFAADIASVLAQLDDLDTTIADGVAEVTAAGATATAAAAASAAEAEGYLQQLLADAAGYRAEALQFLGRVTLNPYQAGAYATLVDDLVESGVWAKLDRYYRLDAPNQAASLQNLKSSAGTLTVTGSPTFLAGTGWKGDNTTAAYLATGFNPSTAGGLLTQNSASIFFRKATNPSTDAGVYIGESTSKLAVFSDETSGITGGRANSSVSLEASNNPGGLGLFGAVRTGASANILYWDGIPTDDDTQASVALPNSEIRILSTTAGGSAGYVASAGWGQALTDADMRNLANAEERFAAAMTVSGIITRGLNATVIDTGNNVTPSHCRLADGRILTVWARSATSGLATAAIVGKLSNADGTYGAQFTIATPPGTDYYSDCSVMCKADGTIIISASRNAASGATSKVFTIRGTVGGNEVITWGTPTDIVSSYTNQATTGRVLEMANGTLILPIYEYLVPFDNIRKAAVVFSSDGGATAFTGQRLVNDGTTAGNRWTEANIVQQSTGRLIQVIRDGAETFVHASRGYYVTTSTDDGQNWSTPVKIFDIDVASRPGKFCLAVLPDDRLFGLARFNGNTGSSYSATGYVMSEGDWLEWSDPQYYFQISTVAMYGAYIYGDCFYDDVTESVLAVVGQGDFITLGEIHFQQFFLP